MEPDTNYWRDYAKRLLPGDLDGDFGVQSRMVRRYPYLRDRYKYLMAIPPDGNVLDVGCGYGRSFLYLASAIRPDLNYFAVDVEDSLMPQLREKVRFGCCDINSQAIPFEGVKFNYIVSINVLEHLRDPVNVFIEAFRNLVPEGIFLLETAHPRSIGNGRYLPRFLQRGNDYVNFYDDPTHIRPYTEKALENLGSIAGFNRSKGYIKREMLYLLALPYFAARYLFTLNSWDFAQVQMIIRGTNVGVICRKSPA